MAGAFRLQASKCELLGSPLYARLLIAAAEDIEAEGTVFSLVGGWQGDPVSAAVALRVMGGVHQAVLRGDAEELAGHYPTTGGDPRWPACRKAFLATIADRPAVLTEAIAHPPQTNEIGRSGVLLGGLLEVARITRLPLRVREIGSSAGLNLLLDRFHYDLAVATWGDAASAVQVRTEWRGEPPRLDTHMTLAGRRGCDIAPLDPRRPADAERLLAFVWADQLDRFHRTSGAIELAHRVPATVDAADAADWLGGELATLPAGEATVVMHSVVIQYLSAQGRQQVERTIHAAARRATRHRPLAWLRLEPTANTFELRLAMWPHGLDVTLADAHPHGAWARWFVGTRSR